MLDLFSGIGGFHKGFEQAGYEFDWVGFSEIDKYASAVYRHRFPKAEELGDITTIQPERDLPDHIDIICGGFPCQAFSVAGKRKGFDDTRGTLFFEIARLLRHYRDAKSPIDYFLLENVKGLLSHDNGRTFATIYGVLSDLGYTVEFQLLNTRWWLPQNRERIYLVGYIGDRSGSKVFPIGETSSLTNNGNTEVANTLQHPGHSGGNCRGMSMVQTFTERSFDGNREDGGRAIRYHKKPGETPCLSSQMGMGGNNVPMFQIPEATKVGAKTGLYKVGELQITAKKRSYDTPKEINEYLKANKKGKTIREIAESLDLPKTQVEHYFRSDKCRAIPSPEHWILLKELLGFDDTYDKQVTDIYEKEVEFESSRRVYSVDGISKTIDTNETGYYAAPVLTPNRAEKRQDGRRFKEDGEDMFTLTGQDQHGVMVKQKEYAPCIRAEHHNTADVHYIPERSKIRRLTPIECCRLQGFPDDWNEFGEFDGEVKPMSDTQRYKQCGNAVTVNVVQAVAERIASPKVQFASKKDV